MEKFGYPSKFITIVPQFHFSSFPVTNYVKGDCVLALTLFSMASSALLTDAFVTARMESDTDVGHFNLRCLKAATKLKETVIRDLLFTDDCGLNASMIWATHLKAVTTSSLSPAPKRPK